MEDFQGAREDDGVQDMEVLAPVRTAQFDTILNEPPVIITQMRVNTCLP